MLVDGIIRNIRVAGDPLGERVQLGRRYKELEIRLINVY